VKLTLYRTEHTADATIGRLSIDGVPFCYTLEDIERPAGAPKVFGKTAIPAGLYRVVIDFSNRFQCPMPHVLDVPGFEGIRIHPGNTAADTEGCILVGMDKLADSIGHSRVAFDALFPKIQQALARGELVSIEVV
jgi:hypothetical protein